MSDPFELELRTALAPLQERLRVAAAEHIATTAQELARSVASRVQEAVRTAAADAASAAERAATDRLTQEFADRERELKEAAVREAAARERVQGGQHQAALDRLAKGVRTLDEARSLSETLDALLAAATGQAERVAIFLAAGDGLRMWRQSGFDKLSEAVSDVVAPGVDGIVAEAVQTRTSRCCGPHEPGRPPFAEPFAADSFVAVPLVMGGRSIAVLCAVTGVTSAGVQGHSTSAMFEILARHAARVLEALTASRLVQVAPQVSAPGAGR